MLEEHHTESGPQPAGGDPRVLVVPVRAHGPFAFSRVYRSDPLVGATWTAMVLNNSFASLPILPAWASKLNEDLIVRSIFGTAAIEGSPLTETEVSSLLVAGPTAVPKSEKERVILNLRRAYELAGVVPGSKPPGAGAEFSEERIRQLHKCICEGLDAKRCLPGTYRVEPVEVGDAEHGGKYKPPKVPEDIKMLMARFVEWANAALPAPDVHPVVRAFLVHYHLALIHPFKDGNGRLARVVEAEMLEQAGFRYVPLMMSNYYYENIDDYYLAFTAAEANHFDLTPFLEFCLSGLVRSLERIHERITDQIRRLALRKHFDDLRQERRLSDRMHRFLLILLDDDVPFSTADLKTVPRFAALYADVTPRTIMRDLRRLAEQRLLEKHEPGRWRLNLRVLD